MVMLIRSVDKAVSMLLAEKNLRLDESDALAVAACHALNRNVQNKLSTQAKKGFGSKRTLKQVFSRGFEK